MRLEELQVYQLAMRIGEETWRTVIRAADSIAANIAEGFGRYHYKENLNFCYYFRGSLKETITWLTKALNRNLISAEKFTELNQLCELLSVKLNNYIKTIGNGLR
jgi:four helix bundle protein